MNRRILVSLSMCMILIMIAFMRCDREDISSFSQEPVRGELPIPKPTLPAKLYLIGRYDSKIDRISDVWSSDDGITWTKEPSPPFKEGRSSHQTIVFKNKIYVIVGTTPGGDSYEDIWSSSDGKKWKKELWKDGSVNSYSSKFSLPY